MTLSPFLESLRISESVFDLSSDLAPVSIRDQIVRATVFVDHLAVFRDSRVPASPLRIVVAGGGVAGAVCVMRCLAYRFDVTWLEKKGSPFSLQLDSDRWLSPFFYEWPWGPWWADAFPVLADVATISFPAGVSSDIAREWQNRFAAIATAPVSRITYKPNTTFDNYDLRNPGAEQPVVVVTFTTTDSTMEKISSDMESDILVIATGAATERRVGQYRGHSFWSIDPFKRLLGRLPPRPHILVSGAGDGALQDFVRICTGTDNAAIVYQSLCAANQPLIAAIERELHATELQSRFSMHLRLGPGCAELTRIEDAYCRAADRLAGDSSVCAVIRSFCEERRDWVIHLLHPCKHSSPIYGINRLLVGLITRIRPDVRVFSGKRLIRIAAGGHTCGDPDICFGKEHTVFAEDQRCGQSPDRGEGAYMGIYNVVIPRHGVELTRRRRSGIHQLLPLHPIATDPPREHEH